MRNLIISTLVITALGCADDKNCKKAVCTEMFAMVSVQLNDTSNSDLLGISTQTMLSGKAIHTQAGKGDFPENSFTVADDSDLEEIGFNSTKALELQIMKGGNVIKTVAYTIKTDCCHISKTEGPLVVSLN